MVKKGELQQWFSRIQYGNEDQRSFSIVFRDFDVYIELSFTEFMNRRSIDNIPLHRISQIRKDSVPIFTRPGFCEICGNPLLNTSCSNKSCLKVKNSL